MKSAFHADGSGKASESLPVWECGLKLFPQTAPALTYIVTPCVGVWIEMQGIQERQKVVCVTPCVGVWIEINRPADPAD